VFLFIYFQKIKIILILIEMFLIILDAN
jgi:hypothetical protein